MIEGDGAEGLPPVYPADAIEFDETLLADAEKEPLPVPVETTRLVPDGIAEDDDILL